MHVEQWEGDLRGLVGPIYEITLDALASLRFLSVREPADGNLTVEARVLTREDRPSRLEEVQYTTTHMPFRDVPHQGW